MNSARIIIPLLVITLVALPLLFRRDQVEVVGDVPQLVIVSPHNEQIRYEFARGFERWHKQKYGEGVVVAWSTPGGTSEIRRMLKAQWEAALIEGRPVGGDADLLFGGGSYEFGQLARPVQVKVDGVMRSETVLEPMDFDASYLKSIYGDQDKIADTPLYSPDGYWFGAALSGFGIVFNRDVLAELDVPDPVIWEDLANPRLYRHVVLVNPLQSGSVTTAFEAILQRLGWTRGWQIMRRAAANAREFAASAPIAPLEVSSGDAAEGVCIDFYGRYQAQAMREGDIASGARSAEEPDRVGYVDPPQQTVIDPDPIAMLRGAPQPELAKRFIEFVLSEHGQALWQYRVQVADGDGLGPERFELRRMPVRRSMYDHLDRFIDQVDPYDIATPVVHANRAFRSFIPVLFDAMAMREPELLSEAWMAIVSHPSYPDTSKIVTADDVDDPELKDMLERFDRMPTVPGPDGAFFDLADPDVLGEVKAGWLRGGWASADLWPEDADPSHFLRRRLGAFFSKEYEAIITSGGQAHARSHAGDR